jgi:sensor histidine kinase YesM
LADSLISNNKRINITLIRIIVILGVLFFVFFIILAVQTNKLNGDALSGGIENEKYFIRSGNFYKEIPATLWYINYILWICSLTTGIGFGLGIIYLISRYGFQAIMRNSFNKSNCPGK